MTISPFQPDFSPHPLDPNKYPSCIYPGSSEALRTFANRYGVQLQGLTVKCKIHLLKILRRWQKVNSKYGGGYSIEEAIDVHLNLSFTNFQLDRLSEVIDVCAIDRLESFTDDDATHLLSHLETWKRELADINT